MPVSDQLCFMSKLKTKALLHLAIFLATRLAILLRHKLHESLLSVTCPETNMSHNFCCCRNRCGK